MNPRITFSATIIAVVLACVSVIFGQQQAGPSAAQQKQLQSLKELRDQGVLSEDEYQAKVKAIGAAAPASNAGSQPTVGLRSVDVSDPVLGMTAATVELPADWKFDGSVARGSDCTSQGAHVRYSVQSADGNTAFELFPTYVWSWNTNANMANGMRQHGCTVVRVLTAADFLKQIMIPKLRPNAQIITVGPLAPEGQARLDAQRQQMIEGTVRNGAAKGFSREQSLKIIGPTLDGGRAHITYSHAGQPIEEWLTAVIQCNVHYPKATYNQPAGENAQCSTQFMSVARAPQGQMETMKPVFNKIALKINPAWDQRMGQIIAQQGRQQEAASWASFNSMMQQNAAAQDARTQQHNAFMQQQDANFANSQARIQANQQNFARGQAQVQANQDAMTHSAVETEKYALGIHTVQNPTTGATTNVNNGYKYTYQRSSDGKIFQTDDPNLKPGDYDRAGETWTATQPAK